MIYLNKIDIHYLHEDKRTFIPPFLSLAPFPTLTRVTPLNDLLIWVMTLCPLVSSDHGLHCITRSFQACGLTQPSSASCSPQTPFSPLQDSSAQQCGALRLQSIGLLRQSQPPRQLPGTRSRAHHHHPPQEGRPGHLPDLALRNQVPAFGQQVQIWPLTARVRGSQ